MRPLISYYMCLLKIANAEKLSQVRVNCSPAKVQGRFQLGLHFYSFSWGNIPYGKIALFCVSNLMSNFFRIYKKKAPDLAPQMPPEPLFLPYMNSQFHYVQNHSMRETNGESCYIQRNERLSSPSSRN